jgi:hypothetical protein
MTHISKINLGYLKDLARILETNVKANFKSNYKDVLADPTKYSENEKILSKRIIYQDKFESKMKVNSKPNLAIQMDPNYKRSHDILLYRSLLTSDPREMLVILYNFEGRTLSPQSAGSNWSNTTSLLVTSEYRTRGKPRSKRIFRTCSPCLERISSQSSGKGFLRASRTLSSCIPISLMTQRFSKTLFRLMKFTTYFLLINN